MFGHRVFPWCKAEADDEVLLRKSTKLVQVTSWNGDDFRLIRGCQAPPWQRNVGGGGLCESYPKITTPRFWTTMHHAQQRDLYISLLSVEAQKTAMHSILIFRGGNLNLRGNDHVLPQLAYSAKNAMIAERRKHVAVRRCATHVCCLFALTTHTLLSGGCNRLVLPIL